MLVFQGTFSDMRYNLSSYNCSICCCSYTNYKYIKFRAQFSIYLFHSLFQIVYQHGGIYCDTDCVRQKPFPKTLQRSFVCYDSSEVYIFNGVFGMPAQSSFLKFALDTLKLNFDRNPSYKNRWVSAKAGPVFFSSVFVSKYYIIQGTFETLNVHFSFISMTQV